MLFLGSPKSQDKLRSVDEKLASSMGILYGTVEYINHPKLGRTKASGIQISFQSQDCSKIAVGIRTDINGKYMILLSKGKYRIFVREDINNGSENISWDWLAPSQRRHFEIMPYKDQRLDVELIFPKEAIDGH
jgi:hypothetical protein